jgi:hypothetical protein
MAGDWRRLTIAVLAAAAVALTCATSVDAQSRAKAAAKKAKPAAADAESGEDGAPKEEPAKKKKQDPAEAQRAIEAAAKLLEAGKADPALQALTTVISGGNLPPAIMAKALYYRGIAYRQEKKPAQAIADLTGALWLKGGLGQNDRADALKQRTSAYQEAGLADGGETVAAAIPSSASAPRPATRTASAAQGWGPSTSTPEGPGNSPAPQAAAAPPQQSGGGWSITNPFAGLFGASSPASNPPPQKPPPPPTTASIVPAQSASAPPVQTSAWSRNTEVRGGQAPVATAAAAPPAKPEGRFRVQVGMVRSESEAQALAAKVKREHAALVAREPEIDQTVVGNMGSFYRVRVGPFATQADGQAACAKLRGSGLDCLVVTQ